MRYQILFVLFYLLCPCPFLIRHIFVSNTISIVANLNNIRFYPKHRLSSLTVEGGMIQ